MTFTSYSLVQNYRTRDLLASPGQRAALTDTQLASMRCYMVLLLMKTNGYQGNVIMEYTALKTQRERMTWKHEAQATDCDIVPLQHRSSRQGGGTEEVLPAIRKCGFHPFLVVITLWLGFMALWLHPSFCKL